MLNSLNSLSIVTYKYITSTIFILHDIQWYLKCKPVRLQGSVVIFCLFSCGRNCCIFDKLQPFWNSIMSVRQWAPAGCMGGNFEAINGDSKGKHSAKCQLCWLDCDNIISRRETQITKINNLIISYSNHAGKRSGSYCSFMSLVCWCIPIYTPDAALKKTVIKRSSSRTTMVTL